MVKGVCMAKEGHVWRSRGACVAGETATVADGTHPTGMHFCYHLILVYFRFNAIELAKRNKHCVAVDQIKRKIKSYERILPVYIGWFLNGTDSRNLLERGGHYFKQCQAAFPAFTSVIRKNADAIGKASHLMHAIGGSKGALGTLIFMQFSAKL